MFQDFGILSSNKLSIIYLHYAYTNWKKKRLEAFIAQKKTHVSKMS